MSLPSAIYIDNQGSLVATMGPNTDVNITSNTGILKNMFDRLKDLVPGEHPVLTIETSKYTLTESERGDGLICIVEDPK